MPYKVPQNRTKDIQRLSQAVKVKQQQLSKLEADHHQLSHRHFLLSATCDILQLLATLKDAANGDHELGEGQQPATAEAELLQQLRGLNYQQSPLLSQRSSATDISGDAPANLQQFGSFTSANSILSTDSGNGDPFNLQNLDESETLGTFEDPLRALRCALQREDMDPYPGIQEVTIEQLQAEYQGLIHQLALNVGFLDNPIIRNRHDEQNPYGCIKRLVSSHCRQLTALLLRGRGYMIPMFFMTDVVTGQRFEEHDPAVYDHAAQRIGLTEVQKELIHATLKVFRSLLGGVLEKRSNAQVILALYNEANGSNGTMNGCNGASRHFPAPYATNSSNSSRSNGSNGRTSMHSSNGTVHKSPEALSKAMLSHQQQQLLEERQQQEQNITAVVKLLQKESLLKACCWASIEGCLTWTQMAKLMIACYPHRASPLALAQAVERLAMQQHEEGEGSGI